MIRAWIAAVVCCAAASAVVPSAVAAQRPDVIRGRVTGPDDRPLSGVAVLAMSVAGGVTRTARTDRDGRYTIVFASGEGDYRLEFALIGYIPRRFEIKRVGDEEVLLGDARMVSSIATLDAVNVSANAPRALPARSDASTDVSGTDRTVSIAELPPEAVGNLAAMAATQPGVQLIPGLDGAPDAFSALGIGPEQNTTALNGLGAALTALPRDAQVNTTVRTFTYDPAVGGFGGAQIAVVTRPGTNFSNRLASGVTRGPPTEITTAAPDEPGATNTVLSLGGSAAGPIRLDRTFYNFSYQADRDWRDRRSLLNAGDAALVAAGVSPDSVARLRGILGGAGGVGGLTTTARLPVDQVVSRLALQGNLDLTPSSSGVGHAFTLSGAANVARASHVGGDRVAMLAVPAHFASARSAAGTLSLRHSNYMWFGVLATTTLGASLSTSATNPYLRAPEGSVRVRSSLPDRESAVRLLRFGGAPVDAAGRSSAMELHHQSTWYEGNNRHAVKFTASARYERFRSEQNANVLGRFTFGSLAALEEGMPETFERQLGSRVRSGGQLVGMLALGDAWRPSRDLQLQYGVRIDANRLTSSPAFNSGVLDVFGYRNDRVPSAVYASPRLGIQWTYGKAPQVISLLAPIARPPRAVVQGGIGVFQQVASAQALLSPVVDLTGLASAVRNVRCTGDAVPSPDWPAFHADPASIPERCADGSLGAPLATRAPAVALYENGYRQPAVLRSNVSWSAPVLDNRFVLSLAGQYQRGFRQPATIDANVDGTPRLTLDDEGGRPVFVPDAAIVAATGAVAPGAGRIDPGYDLVTVLRSTLSQETLLGSVSLRPALANGTFHWSLTYTAQRAREEFLGFASAGGDPFARAWAPAQWPRSHVVAASVFYNALDLVRLNGRVVVASGVAFTPSVIGDVNGDGSPFNDRAFVFDPARADDTAVAAAMQRLLSAGAPAARGCLSAQLGSVAERGSCRGPWQATANLNATLNSHKVGLSPRLRVTVTVHNPLLLADLVAHGRGNVRGWGQAIAPDPTLLAVRGFDASTRRFRYDVNERFGSTRPSQSTQRGQAYLALSVAYDLGPSRERQLLTQRLDLGRKREGTRETPATLRLFGTSTIPNPLPLLLQQPDSFRLTRVQADSLVTLNRTFTRRADSVWSAVGEALAQLPDVYDRDAAYASYVQARESTIDLLIVLAPRAWSLLTPAQRRMLPQAVRDWLDVRVLRAVRSSTSG